MSTVATNFVDSTGMAVNAAYLNNLGAEVNNNTYARTLSGAYADRPAAASSNNGAHYFCTDCDAVYKSNGSAWTKIRVGGQVSPSAMADPSAATWTSVGLGTATIANDKDSRLLTLNGATGQWRGEYTPFNSNQTATFYFEFPSGFDPVFSWAGLFLTNGTTPLSWSAMNWSDSYNYIGRTTWSNFTTNVANTLSGTTPMHMPGFMPNWWRIRDDGTNRYFGVSWNGTDWNEDIRSSESRTAVITPTHIGWGMHTSTASTQGYFRCRSFKIT